MKTITIETEAKPASGIRDLIDPMTLKRRVGMVYYQDLGDGLIARTLTEETNKDFILKLISEKRLYIPIKTIIAETK